MDMQPIVEKIKQETSKFWWNCQVYYPWLPDRYPDPKQLAILGDGLLQFKCEVVSMDDDIRFRLIDINDLTFSRAIHSVLGLPQESPLVGRVISADTICKIMQTARTKLKVETLVKTEPVKVT